MDEEEMHAAGMERNDRGRWHDPARTERTRRALQSSA
jgi:hypothetical protein